MIVSENTWWASLKHGGMLLAPSRLAQYFAQHTQPLDSWTEDRLRRALTRAANSTQVDGSLLDTVLVEVIGLKDGNDFGWQSGSNVDRKFSRPALTGEIIRPRRIWLGPKGAVLPVFVDSEPRIGLGRGRRPFSRVVEWLRSTGHRIALLTNGRQWRLLAAGPDWEAWAEADTGLWFEEGRAGLQVTALRTLLSPAALVPEKAGELSPLITAIDASRRGQAELSSELGERVRQAVELLIQSHGDVLGNRPDITPRAIYVAATRIVMRMVVALFAEARDLLPRDNAIYHQCYGLQGLREALERVGSSDRLQHHHGAWPRVLALFRLIYQGCYHPALPVMRYGGGLFESGDPSASDPVRRVLAIFEDPETAPRDETVYRLLTLLCRSRTRVRQGTSTIWIQVPVDFSDLSSEYIGILYEGLLDYELRRAEEPVIFLALGDEPALPLSRLEAMDDRALPALLEKFKQKQKVSAGEDGGGEEGEEGDAEDEEGTEELEEDLEETELQDAEQQDDNLDEAVEADAAYESGADALRATRERALEWARRAALAGKLMPKPKGSKKGGASQTSFAYDDTLTRIAKTLIRRIVPAGEWFLVRWGGTRKGAGTFYTRPALAVPTAHRTLRPLVYDPPIGDDGEPNEQAPLAEWIPRLPEQILALKICDPAMGSGSFLTASLRFITDGLFKSLHVHGRIVADGVRTLARLTAPNATFNVDAGSDAIEDRLSDEYIPCRPDAEDFEERLRTRLKRHVVERCIYGVDLDPLAVELGRLALWVETMDRELPFEFLDHKLKQGNALIGCWFDRFRDYPAMATHRDGGDEEGTKRIKDFRENTLKPALAKWISPQCTMLEEVDGHSPEALHFEARSTIEKIHGLSVTDTEERERLYRTAGPDAPTQAKLKDAFDTWCALWFWPADSLEMVPLPSQFQYLTAESQEIVARLKREYSFFHWELEFPDVFTEEGAGFDAVVGNPPWEIQKPSSLEFFSNVDPLYRTYGKQDALSRQQEMFEADPAVSEAWLHYNARFKALSNWFGNVGEPYGDYVDFRGRDQESGDRFALVKTWRSRDNYTFHDRWRSRRKERTCYADRTHPFHHQGSADINTYKLFAETGHSILRNGGFLGLIVPSGIYTDKGASALRTLFLNECRWHWIFGFENREKIFDIDSRFKFCPIIIEKGGMTEEIQTAFMRRRLEDWEEAEQHSIPYARAQVERFSPKTKAILEIRDRRDIAILQKIYSNGVLLGDTNPEGWQIKYAREFDMTNDSKLFPALPKWQKDGFVPDIYGRWIKPAAVQEFVMPTPGWIPLLHGGYVHEAEIEEIALPLYEGRMIGQFDFSQKGWVSGKGRTAVWRDIPFDNKVIEPQYLLAVQNIADFRPKICFMDICSATNARTMYATPLHDVPCGHSAPTLQCEHLSTALSLSSVANSFVYDSLLRNRVGGLHLTLNYLEETALPRVPVPVKRFLMTLVIRLAMSAKPFAPQWLQLRSREFPEISNLPWKRLWAIAPSERLRLRCILDAVVAETYNLTFDDLAWILRDCDHTVANVNNKAFARTLDPKGFWRIDKDQHPELRHTVLTLVAFRDLKTLIDRLDGDKSRAIAEFCTMNDGEGWMLPETLCLADLGLGHDERAQQPQPVREKLGPRFLDWQLAQSVEESWAECELHARNLLGAYAYEQLEFELSNPTPSPDASTPKASPSDDPDDFQLVPPDYSPQGKLEF